MIPTETAAVGPCETRTTPRVAQRFSDRAMESRTGLASLGSGGAGRPVCSQDPIPAGYRATSFTGQKGSGASSFSGLFESSPSNPSEPARIEQSACAVSINAPSLYAVWPAGAKRRIGSIRGGRRRIISGIIVRFSVVAIARMRCLIGPFLACEFCLGKIRRIG